MAADLGPDPALPTGPRLESRGDVIFKTWMFCPITGSLLILDAAGGVARSRECRFERPLSDLDETMSVVGGVGEWRGTGGRG
jgi:hypothetical protein